MTVLDFVDVSTGTVMDTVTLDGGRLRFETGAAEEMFAIRRVRFGLSAAAIFDQLSGWSNGYAALRPR